MTVLNRKVIFPMDELRDTNSQAKAVFESGIVRAKVYLAYVPDTAFYTSNPPYLLIGTNTFSCTFYR